jgi:hypothetical protein
MAKVGEFMLASLVFHYQKSLNGKVPYLSQLQKLKHPVMMNPLFSSQLLPKLFEMVECHLGNENDHIHATGIPPHISIIRSIEDASLATRELEKKLESIPSIIEKMKLYRRRQLKLTW